MAALLKNTGALHDSACGWHDRRRGASEVIHAWHKPCKSCKFMKCCAVFGRDAAAAAGHKAGAAASGAAGTAAGTAQTQAGGVPLWALAAGGAAAGLAIYYGFKASPGSHGA